MRGHKWIGRKASPQTEKTLQSLCHDEWWVRCIIFWQKHSIPTPCRVQECGRWSVHLIGWWHIRRHQILVLKYYSKMSVSRAGRSTSYDAWSISPFPQTSSLLPWYSLICIHTTAFVIMKLWGDEASVTDQRDHEASDTHMASFSVPEDTSSFCTGHSAASDPEQISWLLWAPSFSSRKQKHQYGPACS